MLMFKSAGKVREVVRRIYLESFNGRGRIYSHHSIGAILLALGMSTAAQATTPLTAAKPVPAGTWRTLSAASGVAFGSSNQADPAVQIVCDAHCPYCARLYRTLRTDYPELNARWVPIAYFKSDSDRVAAAILASPDRATSLDLNYRQYDEATRRGGYQADSARRDVLPYANATLKQHWQAWGGYTPMVFVRDGQGTVFQASGATGAFLEAALEKIRKPHAEKHP